LTFAAPAGIHFPVKSTLHALPKSLAWLPVTLLVLAGIPSELRAAVPEIIALSGAQTVQKESSAALSVSATGATSHQWYRGNPGDTSNPVAGATGPLLVTPPLRSNASFWVRAGNLDGNTDSAAVTVTIGPPVPGRLFAMGYNFYGQLGDGTTVNRSSPTLITGSVTQVEAGDDHSLHLKTDGTLWASGYNGSGQLGDGSTTSRPSPVLGGTDAAITSAGTYHTLFLKTDGSLWSSGYNNRGQLCASSTSILKPPAKVLDRVGLVAASYENSLILTTNAAGEPPAILNHPASQIVSSGQSSTLSVTFSGSAPATHQW